ncbi:MAG: hypothetical protein CM15mP45_15250 [Deltaproteobacteria bacterium]|nr:MAG: hypothetical protein CM15mP45_15250 [Deltaproteobacteria bacterium]
MIKSENERSTMAVGWAREGAVQEQIDATIDDGVELARASSQGRKPGLL